MKTEPLTKAGFAPFGDVIEIDGAQHFPDQPGFCRTLQRSCPCRCRGGRRAVNISIVIANPRPRPIAIRLMERHPLGSQIFQPLQDRPWLVLVCENPRDAATYRCFRATGRQGINYARNVWHHPLLVLDPDSRFLVVDRKGPGSNLEEIATGEMGLALP